MWPTGLAAPQHEGASRIRDQTHGFCIAGGFFTTEPPGKPQSSISYRNFLPRVEADPKKKAPWTSVPWVAGRGPSVAGTGSPWGGLVWSWLAVLGLVSLFFGLLITCFSCPVLANSPWMGPELAGYFAETSGAFVLVQVPSSVPASGFWELARLGSHSRLHLAVGFPGPGFPMSLQPPVRHSDDSILMTHSHTEAKGPQSHRVRDRRKCRLGSHLSCSATSQGKRILLSQVACVTLGICC